MWFACLLISVACLLGAIACAVAINWYKFAKKRNFSVFHLLFAGVVVATLVMFISVHGCTAEATLWGAWRAFLLSVFNTMQVFTIGCEFSVVKDTLIHCPEWLHTEYQIWAAMLFVLAPVFTFGYVLSLFKNVSAYFKLWGSFRKDVFVFSELNDRSLALAEDIKTNNKKAAIIFTDVFEDNDENTYELIDAAQRLGAICFKKDISVIDFNKHSRKAAVSFFAIGANETENLNQAIRLIERYKHRDNTHMYIFSTKLESALLLTSIDKGLVKVRRINEVQSLVNRLLYEQGGALFEGARVAEDGSKKISAIVVGMGSHGTEITKALAWFCQMDGYKLEIHVFDKDPLAETRFMAMAPELMSPDYNGVEVAGEAQYKIKVHAGIDVMTASFAKEISKITDATYAMVALGSDDVNINTAVNLRMYFERMKIHPMIHAIIYNSQQKKALEGIRNYRGQAYDIAFIGDIESSYTEAVIIDSELEGDALRRHLKWGKEEEFWTYEYNYRSSMASAIHMKARIGCGIPGAAKKEEELTVEERDIIESLEHRRWNAYMRAEGYVFSGSNDKASRNDLAKMHHDLVDFSRLTDDEKRKDSKIGTN